MSRKANDACGIGVQVRRARHEIGWSQEELAKRAGVSRPTIARVETGKNISTATLKRVVEALGKRLSLSG